RSSEVCRHSGVKVGGSPHTAHTEKLTGIPPRLSLSLSARRHGPSIPDRPPSLIVAAAAVVGWAPLVGLTLAPDATGARIASNAASGARFASRMCAPL